MKQGNDKPKRLLDEAEQVYDRASEFSLNLQWLAVGPVLITLGVTNAIYGWTGNSPWMRFFYSFACISFGLLILCFIVWAVVSPDETDDDDSSQED